MPLFDRDRDRDDLDGCNDTDFLDREFITPRWMVPILVLQAGHLTRDEVLDIKRQGEPIFGRFEDGF